MKELKGTKTEANLWKAFAGESQARVKYEYYAAQAKKDGFEQIKGIFEETSLNEKAHAKVWFKLLMGGTMKDTLTNLKDAASGENHEYTDMYVKMAEDAREEGFEDIAKLFDEVAKIEKDHEERFLKFAENIENTEVFTKKTEVVWKCRNCGHIHIGTEAPEVCPACAHPRAHFEVASFNY